MQTLSFAPPPLPLPPLGLLVLLFLLELTNGGSLKVSLQATREGRSKDLGGVRERNIHGKEKSRWWGERGLEKQRGKPKERQKEDLTEDCGPD